MGTLSLLGLDLDPVTMSVVIISIGFSVDFTAHTCYHYHHHNDDSVPIFNKCADPRVRKLTRIYSIVGQPTSQAAISTILTMLPVFLTGTESIIAFAKATVTVVLLGIYHGIILVPVLLSLRFKDDTPRITIRKSCNDIRKSESEHEAMI
uniref:SSD domain-containing protein n=1 Tax=Setaria digitata TaxID=48799 RepID=A0A915PIJ4_9BILA